MLEGFLRLFAARSPTQVMRDLLDVVIVAWVLYRALLVLRGTRAIQMGLGLGIVFLVYLGAKLFGFVTLQSLLSWLLSSIILIVVVVFQNDIRRALIRMGAKAWLSGGREQQSRVIDEVVAAATELARHRMGAIIAFEQDANVLEFCKSEGTPLDSSVTRELLVALFVPESVNKLHDGAVLIRDLKIARAGVFFPMPESKIHDSSLGSRHRAALGITEETDAVVVVVSEERGTISFCFSGNIVSNLDGQSLRHALLGLFGRATKKGAARKPAPALRASLAVAPRSSGAAAPAAAAPTASKPPPSIAPVRARPASDPEPSVSAPAKTLVSTPMRPSSEPLRSSIPDSGPPSVAGAAQATPLPRAPTFVPASVAAAGLGGRGEGAAPDSSPRSARLLGAERSSAPDKAEAAPASASPARAPEDG